MHDHLLWEVRGRRDLIVKATTEHVNFLLAAEHHSEEGRERTMREERGRWSDEVDWDRGLE